jgi:hypothetical protein
VLGVSRNGAKALGGRVTLLFTHFTLISPVIESDLDKILMFDDYFN